MDDGLESNDGKETGCHSGCSNGDQDDQSKETARVAAGLAFEEELGAGSGLGGRHDGRKGGGRWWEMWWLAMPHDIEDSEMQSRARRYASCLSPACESCKLASWRFRVRRDVHDA